MTGSLFFCDEHRTYPVVSTPMKDVIIKEAKFEAFPEAAATSFETIT